MNQTEVKRILKIQTINNFKQKDKIAISIIGDAGMSKSAIVESLPDELKDRFPGKSIGLYKLNGAEYGTDTGNLSGIPKSQSLFEVNGSQEWLTDSEVSVLLNNSQTLTPLYRHRMHSAAPEFVNYLSEFDYSILLIDDVGRCNQSVFNALMELIYKGRYDGWSLPENCVVILTENHDDNSSNDRFEDDAQRTRKVKLPLTEVDIQAWAEDFGYRNLDSVFVDFAVQYWNLDLGKYLKNNLREFTLYAQSMSPLLTEYNLLRNGEESSMYKGVKDALEVCQNDLLEYSKANIGDNITNLFMIDFLDKIINKITPIESVYGKEGVSAEQLVAMIQEDSTKFQGALVANIQLNRIMNLLKRQAKQLTKEEIEYLFTVLESGCFLSLSIQYHNESTFTNDKKVFKALNNSPEMQLRLNKLLSI